MIFRVNSKRKFSQCNLSHIFKYSHFIGNGIEVDELQSLLEPEWKHILVSLIPVPGHRMRFVKNVKKLVKEKSEVSIEVLYIIIS